MAHVQGTSVAIGGIGVLLRGPSGAGKSDLALRLIERGANLIADDLTILRPSGLALIATCPAGFSGRIEARGVGIICVNAEMSAPLGLLVDLVERADLARIARPEQASLLGHPLPRVTVHPFDQSAPLKIELAVRALGQASALSSLPLAAE